MSSQTPEMSVLEAAEILNNFKSCFALAADKSIRSRTAFPSPSPSVREYFTTSISARKRTADYAYSPTSPSKTLPTPRSLRGSTWNCQSPTEDKEYTSNHASSSTSLSRSLLTGYKSPCPSVEDFCPTSLTQQNKRIAEKQSLGDSTDDEEGATTTARDITCHGNTYLNLVPHAGCASWELTRQIDPASIGAQPKSRTPTFEDHNGELDCRRCSIFERSRTRGFASSRSKRESTVPLTEDAQDCIKERRTGAAEYDDDYHENYRLKLRRDQHKRQQRYIIAYIMKPETRARREAERAVRLEQQREAPYERAYSEIRRNRDAETAQIRAENKAEYDREKAMAEARPLVSFGKYVASLPTPDPKSLEAYTGEFVPRNNMIRPPNPANIYQPATVPRQRPSSARTRNNARPKRKPKAEASTSSPPTDSTPSPPSKARGKAPTVPTTPVPANKKRKVSTVHTPPVPAKRKTKPAVVEKPPPPPPTRSSPRTKKPDGGKEGGNVSTVPPSLAAYPTPALATERLHVETGHEAAYSYLRGSDVGQSSRAGVNDEVSSKVGKTPKRR